MAGASACAPLADIPAAIIIAFSGLIGQSKRVHKVARPPLDQRVREAIEAVYRTFDGPRPSAIEGCPCCISTRGTDVLLTTPLRQISGQALWRYVSGVFLTIGDKEDFRYFLPRILDVSVSDPGNANDPEIVLGKLSLAGWRSWTPTERRVVEGFVDAWLEQALQDDLAEADGGWIGTNAESVLCGAAWAGLPLQPWLLRLSAPDAIPVLLDMRQRYPRICQRSGSSRLTAYVRFQ